MVFCVAVDPGRHGGVALVTEGQPGKRPVLLGVRHIGGDRPALWYRRAERGLRELVALIEEGAEVRAYVEDPPKVSRRGTLKGDKRGQRTWAGIGRYQGMAIAACVVAGLGEPVLLPVKAWTSAWGVMVPGGKRGDGTHRIREAELLVEGSREALDSIPVSYRVDAAEAVLMAGAGALARKLLTT